MKQSASREHDSWGVFGVTMSPFYKYKLALIPACISNYIYHKVLDKITDPQQISTVLPSKFGNEKVISSHTLVGMWLLIHTESEVKPC